MDKKITSETENFFEERGLNAKVVRPHYPDLAGLKVSPIVPKTSSYLDQLYTVRGNFRMDLLRRILGEYGFLILENSSLEAYADGIRKVERSEGRALFYHQEERTPEVRGTIQDPRVLNVGGRSILALHMPEQEYEPISPTLLVRPESIAKFIHGHLSRILESNGEVLEIHPIDWKAIADIVKNCRDQVGIALSKDPVDYKGIALELTRLSYNLEYVEPFAGIPYCSLNGLMGVDTEWYKRNVFQYFHKPNSTLVWQDGVLYHGKRHVNLVAADELNHRLERLWVLDGAV